MQRNAMHSPSRSSRTTVSSRNHRQRSCCSVATFAQCLVFASLLHQGAEARLHDAGNRSRRTSASNETGVDLVDVVIGFEKGEVQRGGISDLELLERGGLLGLTADGARSDFRRTNAVSMQIPASEVNSLRSTTGISFVEYDAKAFMHEDEIVTTRATQETNLPWGLAAIQANSKKIPLPLPSSDCFKICIVDSGLLVEHPDIPYTRGAANIAGEEFNIGALSKWDEPIAIANHGTHVTGTMLATGTRNPRVVGVIPNNQNICLLVARVFGDEVNPGASTSTTDRAAEWCGDMGAKVINLSFGSPTFSTNSAAIYRSLRSEGVLLVSSAGNAQDNSKSYPASYSDVISVSSVDKDLQRFWTSQYNDQVDLAAPGVGIVSTVPGMGLFDELGSEYSTALIDYSPFITSPLTAGVVQCGLGTEPCKDAEGRICLIQVGSNAIDDKAFHCEMGGGVAAVIYNSQFTTAPTRGAINSFVSIPVMGVSYADGLALLSKESITVDLQVPSYTEKRGTSMAAPHVAGVAAKIWAARPACSNNQVRDALEATAKDLGDPGRDDMYGHGLIQAEAAYEYLLALPAPCGIGTTGTPNTIQGSDSDSTPTASSGGSTPTTGGGGSTPTIDRETFLANLAKEGTRSQANDKNSLLKSIQNKTGRVRGGGGVRRRFLKGSKAKQ